MYLLSIRKVERGEQGVVLRGWLAGLILVQESRWAAHLYTQLLNSLLIVNGQQEGLEARLGAHGGQDGEILRKNAAWRKNGRTEQAGEVFTGACWVTATN